MSGTALSVSAGCFCEIWLMRGAVVVVYKKFNTQERVADSGWYDIVMNDFFMHMDTPAETGSVNYWVKMRTYAYIKSEHDRIQNAMRCEWMLLEAKR